MYGNNMYQRNYSINQQNLYEQIDNEINNLQQMKERMKNNNTQQQAQQPSINQTFQLAPTSRDAMKYANSIEEVQRDIVIGDTPYFAKDMSIVWVKSINGTIKSYELKEIIPKDEKDLQIEYLKAQIEELKKGMNKDERYTNVDDTIAKSTKDEKSSNVSAVSKSKEK